MTGGQRRLRVLHVGKYYPPFKGGIETHLEALARGLCGLVEQTVLVANHAPGPEVDEVRDGVRVRRLSAPLTLRSTALCPGTLRAIRETQADIIHLHLPNPPAAIACLIGLPDGCRLVASYHSDIVRQRVLAALLRPVEHRLLSRCDAIVAATPRHIDGSAVLSKHAGRCRTIPYGLDPAPFRDVDPPAVASLRARFGSRIVLAVGRLVYYKGFQYLLEAMQSVDGHLVLVGDGPLRAELVARAEALGVAGRVTFLGRVDDLVPLYSAADVFVLPSIARSEAFGLVQLEAMAAGTPVINTALDTGVPLVSVHGRTGLTVPPRDARALADAVNCLLHDPVLRSAYGRAAHEVVASEYTAELMSRRMLALYTELTARPAHPAARAPAGRSAATSAR